MPNLMINKIKKELETRIQTLEGSRDIYNQGYKEACINILALIRKEERR